MSEDMLNYFRDQHFHLHDEKYVPTWGRDRKIFKELKKEIEDDKILRELIIMYLKKPAKWYSPVFFKTSIQEFYMKYKKENKPRPKFVNTERGRYENN